MFITHDGVTGAPLMRRELHPGEAMDVYFDCDVLDHHSLGALDVEKPVAVDEIGREFKGDADQFRASVAELFRA